MRTRKEIQIDLWANDEERKGKKGGASKKAHASKAKPQQAPPAEPNISIRKRMSSTHIIKSVTNALPEDLLASSLAKKSTSEMYFNFLLFGRYGYIGARVDFGSSSNS